MRIPGTESKWPSFFEPSGQGLHISEDHITGTDCTSLQTLLPASLVLKHSRK